MFTTAVSDPKFLQSQGSAVMHNTVSALPAAVKQKIVAGVLFGDTRNKQDGGQVKNYPKDQVMIFCYEDDGVCGGALQVTGAHMNYRKNNEGPKAVAFLKGKIDPALPTSAPARRTEGSVPERMYAMTWK
jgi:cutinase